MQIQITLKSVTTETPQGKRYQVAKVEYTDQKGEDRKTQVFSFKNPAVFATLKDAKPGVYDVEITKNGDYWDWSQVKPATEKAAEGTAPTPTKATGSTYETREERARRQVYIVRQSSLGHALEFYKDHTDGCDVKEVLALAQEFVNFVFDEGVEKGEVGTGT